MQMFFKDADNHTHTIEVEASDTVAAVKTKMLTTAGYTTNTGIKIIFAGKILEDQRTLSDYNIQKYECDVRVIFSDVDYINRPGPGCSVS